MSNATQTDHLKTLLQPNVLIELGAIVSSPLDLLKLRSQLELRRLSEGGDSTTPEPTVKQLIQFKLETWEALSRLAEQLAGRGASVTPAEVATLLLERSLAQINGDAQE